MRQKRKINCDICNDLLTVPRKRIMLQEERKIPKKGYKTMDWISTHPTIYLCEECLEKLVTFLEGEIMPRPYLTVTNYAIKYDIPRSTVYTWIRQGKLEAREDVRPKLVLDEKPAPEKDPAIHKWRYQF